MAPQLTLVWALAAFALLRKIGWIKRGDLSL